MLLFKKTFTKNSEHHPAPQNRAPGAAASPLVKGSGSPPVKSCACAGTVSPSIATDGAAIFSAPGFATRTYGREGFRSPRALTLVDTVRLCNLRNHFFHPPMC